MNEKLEQYFKLCQARIDKIFADPTRYGYEENFLDKERGAAWENFTEAHQGVLLDRFAFVYSKNIEEIHHLQTTDPELNVLQYVAEKAIPLHEENEPSVSENLFRDKLMSRDGFILEMPGISANITQNEIDHRKEIFAAVGLDADQITLRNKVGHSTYDLTVGKKDDKLIAAKDIISGSLQGVHRKMVNKDQATLMKESLTKAIEEISEKDQTEENLSLLNKLRSNLTEVETMKDVRTFNAGSQVFIPSLNAGKSSQVVGEDILALGQEIHETNVADSSPTFQGFTAGVSGNAMHYAITGMEFARQVLHKDMSKKELEQMYKVVEKHLVGTDQAPLHHSRPETKMGFEIGQAFASNAANDSLMNESSIKQTLLSIKEKTSRYINFVKAKKLLAQMIRKNIATSINASPSRNTAHLADKRNAREN